MKQFFLFFLFLMTALHVEAADLKNIKIGNTTLYYYFSGSIKEKKGLLIFMHGAVSQYKNHTESKSVPVETLIENNATFLAAFNNDGYDVILPISFNEYNWLEAKGKIFIDTLLKMHKGLYPQTFLSGFSDGGTGAYKLFYTSPSQYDGVIIFNGYPQHQNFYKTVNYGKVNYQKVFFFSQTSDKVIPPEFLMTEYRRQKMLNKQTYFFLKPGHHKFNEYQKTDFEDCIALMDTIVAEFQPEPYEMLVYPPIDGLLIANRVIALYEFKGNKVKKYGMKKTEYQRNDYDYSTFSKMMKNGRLVFLPVIIRKEDLLKNDTIEFTYEYQGKQYKIALNNYLKMKAF